MRQPNLISVIMPCFNSDKYLSEALHSVLVQTYSNWEIIIVDDGSTDNSVSIISKFVNQHPEKIKLYHNSGKGACSARNEGLKKSSGEYIKFLDSDDALYNNQVFEKQLDFISTKNCDIVYGDEYYFSEVLIDKFLTRIRRAGNICQRNPSTFYTNFPITTNFFTTFEVLKEFTWDEQLRAGQEFFLLFQLFIADKKFCYQAEAIAKIRIHNSSSRISNQSKSKYYSNSVILVDKMKNYLNFRISDNQILELNKYILRVSFIAYRSGQLTYAKQLHKRLLSEVSLSNYPSKIRLILLLNKISIHLAYPFYNFLILRRKSNH